MKTARTPQELDPLGGITARLIVIVGGVIALVIAIGMSAANASEISSVPLAIAAIVALGLTAAYFVRVSSPYRAPLRAHSHLIICLGAISAITLEASSQWGTNALVRDDWGPIAMAVVVITLGSYRPPLELLAAAIGSTVLVSLIAIAVYASGSLVTPVPVTVFIVTMATPVLAAGIGSAAFSAASIRSHRAWKQELVGTPRIAPLTEDAPTGHLAFLHGTVIPFLDSVVTTGELAADDGARARRLAQELRVLMVLDSEQSWLTGVVDRFDDPARVAHELDSAQRASLRAIVTHVQTSEAFAKGSVRVRLGLENGEAIGVLEADIIAPSNARVQLAPFIAVSRSAFSASHTDFTSSRFTLTFRI
jgi:hypothetical protein